MNDVMTSVAQETLERYFTAYREGIIGQHETIQTPFHDAIPLVYADWTASGRMYQPIEDRIREIIIIKALV